MLTFVILRWELAQRSPSSVIYVNFYNLCKCVPAKKPVGKWHKLKSGIMKTLASKTEQIQS